VESSLIPNPTGLSLAERKVYSTITTRQSQTHLESAFAWPACSNLARWKATVTRCASKSLCLLVDGGAMCWFVSLYPKPLMVALLPSGGKVGHITCLLFLCLANLEPCRQNRPFDVSPCSFRHKRGHGFVMNTPPPQPNLSARDLRFQLIQSSQTHACKYMNIALDVFM
jgi:hypothetical protein